MLCYYVIMLLLKMLLNAMLLHYHATVKYATQRQYATSYVMAMVMFAILQTFGVEMIDWLIDVINYFWFKIGWVENPVWTYLAIKTKYIGNVNLNEQSLTIWKILSSILGASQTTTIVLMFNCRTSRSMSMTARSPSFSDCSCQILTSRCEFFISSAVRRIPLQIKRPVLNDERTSMSVRDWRKVDML